jgi:hypothetical protein
MFVGFQCPISLTAGVRDALTRYTRPISSAYHFVPSTESLRQLR